MKKRVKKIASIVVLSCLPTLSFADAQTEVGAYLFASKVKGQTKYQNVTTDVDVSFADVLSHLDFGFMGFFEHRYEEWSIIGDIFYANLSAKKSKSFYSLASISLEADLKQTLVEAFLAYKLFKNSSKNGIDILGGIRYNNLDLNLDSRLSFLFSGWAASRNPSVNWFDGVIGLRGRYDLENGWGVMGWADIGKGSDSSSYQLAAFADYSFQNGIKTFLGYRYYHFNYDAGAASFQLDLDYYGPMLGLSYTF